MRGWSLAKVLATLAVLFPASATAAPLSGEACARLVGEIRSLEDAGARSLLARGPDNASQLSVLDRQRIKRLLDADAQFKFRCPQDRPLIVLREESVEESQDQVLPGDDEAATGAPAPKKKAKDEQPQPKQSRRVANPNETAAPSPPQKAQRPTQPRPKSDDAFRPQTPGPTVAPITPTK